jgi:chromosome segregation ATPase
MGIFKKGKSEKTESDLAAEELMGTYGKQEEQIKSNEVSAEEEQRTLTLLKKDESDNGDIFNILNNLRDELAEFEKIKKGITAKIETTSSLIPQLTEKMELLTKQINEKEKQIAEIEELVPKLDTKKQDLESYILSKKEEIELLEREIQEKQVRSEEINQLIPKLERNRKKINTVLNERREELSKVEEQIGQINDIQKYGIDLLSTLMYATKKSKV